MVDRDLTMRTLFFLALVALAVPAYGQSGDAPPDLSGVWQRDFVMQNLFESVPGGPALIAQDPRYPKTYATFVPQRVLTDQEIENVIEFTSSWIPNPNNPILQPWTGAALEEIAGQELAGIPHPEMQTLCKPSGVPHIVNILNRTMILQTPTEVIFLYERDHQIRHVFLNVPHSDDPGHTWYGESVGHYEGDTLVIDTIGQNNLTHIDRFATPHSEQIHVVERYRVGENDQTMLALVTTEDPIAFTVPLLGHAHYVRRDNGWSENVCAENNERQFWPGHHLPVAVDFTSDF